MYSHSMQSKAYGKVAILNLLARTREFADLRRDSDHCATRGSTSTNGGAVKGGCGYTCGGSSSSKEILVEAC